MGKLKKNRKLSDWNKFIRDNSHLAKFKLPSGSPDLKKLSRAFKGKSTSKSKPKPRATTTTRRVTTTTSKPKPKSRPKGKSERKVLAFKKEFDDIRRAMGIPAAKASFKIVSGTWRLKAGAIKVKRKKLGDAMREFSKRARKVI